MTEPRKLRVFLCHASQDKHIVRELYQRLLTEGWIDPWLDEEKLLPGQDWDLEIEKAVISADAVIVFLSNRSVNKEGYIQRELRFALDIALEKPEGTIYIIPLRLDECAPPRKLRAWQYVDFYPLEVREKKFQLIIKSFEQRLSSIINSEASEKIIDKTNVPLSVLINTKKFSEARLALQDDRLKEAVENFQVLIKQNFRIEEILADLEDVSVIYKGNREFELLLATAYHAIGNHDRARELESIYMHWVHQDQPSDNNPEITVDQSYSDSESVPDWLKEAGWEEAEINNSKSETGYSDLPNWVKEMAPSPDQKLSLLPSSICIETINGISTPVFYKGDYLPLKRNFTYSTATDNQSRVEIHLTLGENRMAKDNVTIRKYILDGIQSAPKGVPQIEILFEINRNLELSVVATDKATGKSQNYQVVKINTINQPPIKDPLPPRSDPSLDRMFNSSDGYSDFIKTIFGVSSGQSSSSQIQDYEQEIELTFEEAYKGTSRRLQSDGEKKLVKIPAGVYTGSKIRVAGQGPYGVDLFLTVSIQPHPFFTRNGADLYMRYPISESLAQQGGKLQVPLVEKGKSMNIIIPPDSKDKQVFRFANRGFPKLKESKKTGDFYLTIDIYFPHNMPQIFKKLLDDIIDHMK